MPLQAPLPHKPQLILVPPLNSAIIASSVLSHSLVPSTLGFECCKEVELRQRCPPVPRARVSLTGPLSLISGFPPGGIAHGFPPRSQRSHSRVIFPCNSVSHSCATHLVLGLLTGQDFSWEVKASLIRK